MDFITVKAAAEKWGVSTRRVQILCAQDRVKGAYRFGKSWMIPSAAILPNAYRTEEERLPMPRRSIALVLKTPSAQIAGLGLLL